MNRVLEIVWFIAGLACLFLGIYYLLFATDFSKKNVTVSIVAAIVCFLMYLMRGYKRRVEDRLKNKS